MEGVVDNTDLEKKYDAKRHLLYFPVTGTTDRIFVTCDEVPSRFLEHLVSRQLGGGAHG